jgi:hypothetical protein
LIAFPATSQKHALDGTGESWFAVSLPPPAMSVGLAGQIFRQTKSQP